MLYSDEYIKTDDGLVYLEVYVVRDYRARVRHWMRENASDYVDPVTGELCCTDLAVAAADEFDLYTRFNLIPEDLFEWAAELADESIAN